MWWGRAAQRLTKASQTHNRTRFGSAQRREDQISQGQQMVDQANTDQARHITRRQLFLFKLEATKSMHWIRASAQYQKSRDME